jgi:hypothetical protein
MDIEQSVVVLQSLIAQLSVDTPKCSTDFAGEPDEVLAGLRELYLLHLITATFINGNIVDPLGYQWISADNILLTKRGAALKPL